MALQRIAQTRSHFWIQTTMQSNLYLASWGSKCLLFKQGRTIRRHTVLRDNYAIRLPATALLGRDPRQLAGGIGHDFGPVFRFRSVRLSRRRRRAPTSRRLRV